MDEFAQLLLDDHHRVVRNVGQDDDVRFCALALAGEAGELCNIVKKEWRDNTDMSRERQMEAADVLVYLLLFTKMNGWTFEELVSMAHYKHEQFMAKHL